MNKQTTDTCTHTHDTEKVHFILTQHLSVLLSVYTHMWQQQEAVHCKLSTYLFQGRVTAEAGQCV